MKTKDPPTPNQPLAILSASLFYDDAPAAIEWLCQAFGFQRRLVVPGPNGTIMHSELSFGTAIIMVATAKPEMGWVSPKGLPAIHGALCGYVADPDAHLRGAKAAGAVVVRDIRDEEYGGRGYMVRDPEGHQWYFGSYQLGTHWEE